MVKQDDLIRRGEVIESVRRIIQAGLPEEAIYDEINKIPSAFNKQRTINTIEEQILNLTTGLGYDRMGNIPMQRKDFQGYRRKTIETYNRYMILNGKQIV